MKLFEAFQAPGFHTAIMTSFGIEFDAFESIALARLRNAECRNVILVCDAGMLALALSDLSRPPKFAGIEYLVMKARAAGVFHPKILVQIGKERGRLIVASANATAPGLAGNLEVAAVIECSADDSGERQLVMSGWHYATSFVDERQHAASDKLRFAREKSPWLEMVEPAAGPVTLADGTQSALLTSGQNTGIARRFVDLIGAGRTEQLVVASPYWDDELNALEYLRDKLKPRRTVVLIDTKRRLFPVDAVGRGAGFQVTELHGFAKKHFPPGNDRFIHAKVFVATSGGRDHVLIGSPNCTLAALGNDRRSGSNEEVALYRRLPKGRIFKELDLVATLQEKRKLDLKHIPKKAAQEKLPLNEAAESDPGIFELAFERIFWWPRSQPLAASVVQGRATLELLDALMRPIASKLQIVADSKHPIFRLEKTDIRPAFARIRRGDGTHSGLAIIASVEDLRTNMRDRLSAKAERVIRDLEFDHDEGLWLLDAIHTLGAGPQEHAPIPVPRVIGKRGKKAAPARGAKLDFETFMRGRHREMANSDSERNSLVGSHVSYVRAALNRLLGISAKTVKPATTVDENSDDVALALDRGDEVANAEEAVDEGFEPKAPAALDGTDSAFLRRRREQDANAIAYAVDDLTEELGKPDRALDAVDMLRVRALLTVIGVAARPAHLAPGGVTSQMQVLPCSEEHNADTWPRLMGRILIKIFGGPDPAIKRLEFESAHDRVPDDILEAWACCVWFAQAALAATTKDPGCAKLVPYLNKLALSVTSTLALSTEEMSSPSFVGVLERLDQRFGPRLRLGALKQLCIKRDGFEAPQNASKSTATGIAQAM